MSGCILVQHQLLQLVRGGSGIIESKWQYLIGLVGHFEGQSSGKEASYCFVGSNLSSR